MRRMAIRQARLERVALRRLELLPLHPEPHKCERTILRGIVALRVRANAKEARTPCRRGLGSVARRFAPDDRDVHLLRRVAGEPAFARTPDRRHHLRPDAASDPQLRQHLCQDLTTEGIAQS